MKASKFPFKIPVEKEEKREPLKRAVAAGVLGLEVLSGAFLGLRKDLGIIPEAVFAKVLPGRLSVFYQKIRENKIKNLVTLSETVAKIKNFKVKRAVRSGLQRRPQSVEPVEGERINQKISSALAETLKVETKEFYTVRKGDSLWKIAEKFYGKGEEWTKIFVANRDKISKPGLIQEGQILAIPSIKSIKEVLGTAAVEEKTAPRPVFVKMENEVTKAAVKISTLATLVNQIQESSRNIETAQNPYLVSKEVARENSLIEKAVSGVRQTSQIIEKFKSNPKLVEDQEFIMVAGETEKLNNAVSGITAQVNQAGEELNSSLREFGSSSATAEFREVSPTPDLTSKDSWQVMQEALAQSRGEYERRLEGEIGRNIDDVLAEERARAGASQEAQINLDSYMREQGFVVDQNVFINEFIINFRQQYGPGATPADLTSFLADNYSTQELMQLNDFIVQAQNMPFKDIESIPVMGSGMLGMNPTRETYDYTQSLFSQAQDLVSLAIQSRAYDQIYGIPTQLIPPFPGYEESTKGETSQQISETGPVTPIGLELETPSQTQETPPQDKVVGWDLTLEVAPMPRIIPIENIVQQIDALADGSLNEANIVVNAFRNAENSLANNDEVMATNVTFDAALAALNIAQNANSANQLVNSSSRYSSSNPNEINYINDRVETINTLAEISRTVAEQTSSLVGQAAVTAQPTEREILATQIQNLQNELQDIQAQISEAPGPVAQNLDIRDVSTALSRASSDQSDVISNATNAFNSAQATEFAVSTGDVNSAIKAANDARVASANAATSLNGVIEVAEYVNTIAPDSSDANRAINMAQTAGFYANASDQLAEYAQGLAAGSALFGPDVDIGDLRGNVSQGLGETGQMPSEFEPPPVPPLPPVSQEESISGNIVPEKIESIKLETAPNPIEQINSAVEGAVSAAEAAEISATWAANYAAQASATNAEAAEVAVEAARVAAADARTSAEAATAAASQGDVSAVMAASNDALAAAAAANLAASDAGKAAGIPGMIGSGGTAWDAWKDYVGQGTAWNAFWNLGTTGWEAWLDYNEDLGVDTTTASWPGEANWSYYDGNWHYNAGGGWTFNYDPLEGLVYDNDFGTWSSDTGSGWWDYAGSDWSYTGGGWSYTGGSYGGSWGSSYGGIGAGCGW